MIVTLFVTGVIYRTERYISKESGATWINRKIFGTLIGIALTIASLFGFAWIAAMSIVHAEAPAMLIAGCMTLMVAYALDRHLMWAGLGFVATAAGVLYLPQCRGLIVALGGLASFSLGAWGWRKVEQSEPNDSE